MGGFGRIDSKDDGTYSDLELADIRASGLTAVRLSLAPEGAFWFNDLPPGYGYGLRFVVTVWLGVVILLYLPCRAWARLKARRRDVWLSYL